MLNGIKRSAKRRLAVFLAVLMLMTCTPVSILADETDDEVAAEELTEEVSVPEDEQIPEESSLSESEEGSEEAGEIAEDISASESEELQDDSQSETSVPEGYVGVWTKDDLYEVRSNPSGSYIQMADIIFTEEDFSEDGDFCNMGLGWDPIGTTNTPFTGTYDGNGYVICGLQNTATASYQGLFGCANGATLKNIHLEDAVFRGGSYVGGIVGYAVTCSINRCVADVQITANGDNVGGIVGYASTCSINRCVADVQITANGDNVGGIAGSITVRTGSQKVGRCDVCGSISGNTNVGGIAGSLLLVNTDTSLANESYLTIEKVRNTADIYGTEAVGGIVGRASGMIYRYNNGNYQWNNNRVATTINCYNTGNVEGEKQIGGIAGYLNIASCEKSYSIGQISGNSDFGGIYGAASITTESFCYYLYTGVTDPTNTAGTAKDKSMLKRRGTYEQWDFDTVWTMDGDPTYPYAELQCFPVEESTVLSISEASVSLPQEEYAYTGDPITPEVTVSLNGTTLKKDIDYTVKYADNQREGTATVTVTGIGKYRDTATATFRITGHLYGEWIVEKEATCTEAGLRYRNCPGCDDREEEEIPALGHDFADEIIPPTLTEQGYTLHTCSRCGYEEKDNYTDPIPFSARMDADTVYVETADPEAIIVVAAYRANGQLAEVHLISTEQQLMEYSCTLESAEDAAVVRVFFLDGKTRQPLAPAQSFYHTVSQNNGLRKLF